MWHHGIQAGNLFGLWKKIQHLLVLNTFDQNPDGLTLYDLKKIGHIPHSKIYRLMNKLESEGILQKMEQKGETGRPKYIFSLTDKGKGKLGELRSYLQTELENLKQSMPESSPLRAYDLDELLNKGNLGVFKDPIERILCKDIPNIEKIEHLTDLEEHFQEMIQKIHDTKHKLKINEQ
jgi:DNA-binding PadR family transcriptional regulator